MSRISARSTISGALLILGLVALTACQAPRSVDLRPSATLSPVPPDQIAASGRPSVLNDVVFLHLSVGRNLIYQGDLRGLLASRGYQLYDQGYNEVDGLHLPDGSRADYDYDVPDDNTYPDGLATIFSQPVDSASVTGTGAPANTLSGLLRHKVIVFKSCYPATLIESDAQLELYKSYYLQIRETIDRYPDNLFIPLTPPPLEPGSTNPAAAQRAREFANWLKSPEYTAGHPNLYVFDLFDLLAERDASKAEYNSLRLDYQEPPAGFKARVRRGLITAIDFAGQGSRATRLLASEDSHPNVVANRTIAPALTAAIDAAAHSLEATLSAGSRV